MLQISIEVLLFLFFVQISLYLNKKKSIVYLYKWQEEVEILETMEELWVQGFLECSVLLYNALRQILRFIVVL